MGLGSQRDNVDEQGIPHTTMSQNILIVEDEPPMQDRLRRILEGLDLGQPDLLFAASVAQAKALGRQDNLMLGLIDLG